MAEIEKLPCVECGALILPTTAVKNDGKCAPCKGGYRVDLEASRKWQEEQKALHDAPDSVYWRSLVNRVHGEDNGFEKLPENEKLYFAVCCLNGEVFNGGFYQYFSNSSSDYYTYAVEGLKALGATKCLAILEEAKNAVFNGMDVPKDWSVRNSLLPELSDDVEEDEVLRKLDTVDARFYEDPDSLFDLLQQFGIQHHFWVNAPEKV
jgi:hypothetical protein